MNRSSAGCWSCFLAAGLLISACSSTTQIETSPPRPRTPDAAEHVESAGRARLLVLLQGGTTSLPDDVDLLRFRISEVQLRQENGEWLRLASDLHVVELERGKNGLRRTVLDTRVPPAVYDSMALTFDRVFVQFGENAGAPLTAGSGTPHRMALRLAPSLSEPLSLLLSFEPGASLSRSSDCRWFFVPLVRTEIISVPAPTEQG